MYKCGFNSMAPVEHTKWMASTWDCTLGHDCIHWASQLTMDCSGVHFFTVELLWTAFHKLLPPPTPPLCPYCLPTLLATLAQNWCAPSKNDLKWPKIKQVTNSKLYYIKFNRSISTVLLNKAGLTQAKVGYTN